MDDSPERALALQTEHAPGGGHPEPTLPVLGKAQDRLPQRLRRLAGALDAARSHEGQTLGGPDPEHSRRVFEETVHALRGQALRGAVDLEASLRERVQAVRRGEPHRPVGGVADRGDRVGSQAVRRRVGGEATVAQAAEAAAQGPRPHRSVAAFVNRVHAVLGQPVRTGVGLRRVRVPFEPQVSQPAPLPADPQAALASGERVDDVGAEPRGGHGSHPTVAEPEEPALGRSEPRPPHRIHVNRAVAIRRQALGPRVGREPGIAQALDSSRAADPQVALPVFEERGHRPP